MNEDSLPIARRHVTADNGLADPAEDLLGEGPTVGLGRFGLEGAIVQVEVDTARVAAERAAAALAKELQEGALPMSQTEPAPTPPPP